MENRVEKIFAEEQEKPEDQRLLVSFILDESGSMESCKEATISGFNEYIGSLKRRRGTIRMTLTQFDSAKVEIIHNDVPIAEVEPLTNETYQPGAATPLYDAIAKTIQVIPEERANVLCIIMTDGEENSSQEYRKEAIQTMIKEKEDKGWTFVYLGANQNAWSTARSIGMSAMSNSANYDFSNQGFTQTFNTLAENTLCYISQTTSFFSDKDKKQMEKMSSGTIEMRLKEDGDLKEFNRIGK